MNREQPSPYWTRYYSVTDRGLVPGVGAALQSESMHLHDVWNLCRRGLWELELRQFVPPASLARCIRSLMEMGLIQCSDLPPAHSST